MILKFDYRVMESSRTIDLEEKIIRMLHDGWELVGGVCFDAYSRSYLQALKKGYTKPQEVKE